MIDFNQFCRILLDGVYFQTFKKLRNNVNGSVNAVKEKASTFTLNGEISLLYFAALVF
jgi:hypothetical protein